MTIHPTARELRACGPIVSAGALAGDLGAIADSVAALEAGGARAVHVDVGDGVYSPLLLGGPAEVAAVRPRAYKDVHLMILDPIRHVDAFAAAGADAITVQLDAGRHVIQALRAIGAHASAQHPERPILRGIALPLELGPAALLPVLDEVDLVLVLGVVPGYRGAAAADFAARVSAVRELVDRERPGTLVSADGGVTHALAPELAAAGADLVVSGSALFTTGDAAAAVAAMQASIAASAHAPGAAQSGSSEPSMAAGSRLA